MRLLLDTNVLLWWLFGNDTLKPSVTDAISEAEEVFISAATVWEIAIKESLGKLQPPEDLLASIDREGFHSLSITVEHAVAAGSLPRHHGDPFDRMLIAQARLENLTLVSRDAIISQYAVAWLRA